MTFEKQIEHTRCVLERRKGHDDATSATGSSLILRTPHIAPKAYFHVLHAPLSQQDIETLDQRLISGLHSDLKLLYSRLNGGMIFSGGIRLMGYVPHETTQSVSPHTYPSNIVAYEEPTLLEGGLRIAFYKYDGSFCYIRDTGEVVRSVPENKPIWVQRWDNVFDWLETEVVRMDEKFDELGRPIGEPSDLFASRCS